MSIVSIIIIVIVFLIFSPIIVPFLLFTPIGWLLMFGMFIGFWIWVIMAIINLIRSVVKR